jgi:hypothetical protein
MNGKILRRVELPTPPRKTLLEKVGKLVVEIRSGDCDERLAIAHRITRKLGP